MKTFTILLATFLLMIVVTTRALAEDTTDAAASGDACPVVQPIRGSTPDLGCFDVQGVIPSKPTVSPEAALHAASNPQNPTDGQTTPAGGKKKSAN